MSNTNKRVESDSLGEVLVDKDKLWGAQTQRSFENFKIGKEKMPLEIIKALAIVKKACAKANLHFKKMNSNMAKAIIIGANKIISGELDDQFPLVVWQTGSGTQTNMNVNEVIANIVKNKIKEINPNDHVNMSQSSNDVFPTAMHIAFVLKIINHLIPSLDATIKTLNSLKTKYKDVIKIGRTHLQDATPLTIGQEISAWEYALISNKKMIIDSLSQLKCLAIGGTAVGTGLNAPIGFDKEVTKNISQICGTKFSSSPNKFHSLSFKDAILNTHGTIETLATSLFKIANDIR